MKNFKAQVLSKKFIYPALSLFVICLVSVLLLATVNAFTKNKTGDAANEQEKQMRAEVFPNAASYAEKDDRTDCIGEDGKLAGYIFVTKGTGYAGAVTVMTGIDLSGKITGVAVLSHTETPSFGGKAIDAGYPEIYKDKDAEAFQVGENIDAYTGATRTSEGIAGAVNEAVAKFGVLKEGTQ